MSDELLSKRPVAHLWVDENPGEYDDEDSWLVKGERCFVDVAYNDTDEIGLSALTGDNMAPTAEIVFTSTGAIMAGVALLTLGHRSMLDTSTELDELVERATKAVMGIAGDD